MRPPSDAATPPDADAIARDHVAQGELAHLSPVCLQDLRQVVQIVADRPASALRAAIENDNLHVELPSGGGPPEPDRGHVSEPPANPTP